MDRMRQNVHRFSRTIPGLRPLPEVEHREQLLLPIAPGKGKQAFLVVRQQRRIAARAQRGVRLTQGD